nr:MAG: replication associated protein [ssDNA virus sp.]
MVRFYYRRRGRFYRIGRRWRRRYYRRRGKSAPKYVNGGTRSAIRMKTSLNTTYAVNLTAADPVSVPIKYVALTTGAAGGVALVSSPLFRQYANLYDEMKVIGMKVDIAVTTPVGTAGLPSVELHTAWDRKSYYGEPNPTAADLQAASTHSVATALNNNVAKISRSLFASDLIEKALMFQSPKPTGAGPWNISAWGNAQANFMAFSPGFIWYVSVPNLGADVTINFTVNVTYWVGFRSPRYGGGANRALVEDLGPVRRGHDDGDVDDGGDMDQGDVFDDFVAAAADGAAAASADAPGDVDISAPAPVSRRQLSAASAAAHAAQAPSSRRRKNV